jgi:hypothetical protein
MFDPKLRGIVYATAAAVLVTGCGADDIASPGTGGNITINNPAAPPPPPPPPPPATVSAAGACPTIADPQGLTDAGTISGPTGSYRICQLPSLIKVSSSLPKLTGVLYSMNGRVNVGCDGGFVAPTVDSPYTSTTVGCTSTPLTADTNVTLTIAPGVILYGATGQSWLAVNRGNKISAVGTASLPIIFTSKDNVAGINDDTNQGQWGGVVLLGRGITTDCLTGTTSGNSCERDTEGAADKALYGGTNNTYNAGTLSYVQIRYSGFVLGSNKELQSLTTGSIGTGTTLSNIQSHNSSDDGVEFFGGAVNMKNYVATGADDDSLDIDTGAEANIQFALLIQRAGRGDALMEIDSNSNESDAPRSIVRIANFTALQPLTSSDNEGSGGDLAATLFRGNSDTTLINGIVATPNNECIRMNASGTTPATLTARSVVLQCNATKFLGTGNYNASQVGTFFGTGSSNNNNDAFTTSFSSLFINGANETAIVFTDPTTFANFSSTVQSFFTSTNYVGAVKDGTAGSAWYAGWTCNSSTATLGTSVTGLCTSLPTY